MLGSEDDTLHVGKGLREFPYCAWYDNELPVGDVIFASNDTISVQKRTNFMWATTRGTHKIPKKKK